MRTAAVVLMTPLRHQGNGRDFASAAPVPALQFIRPGKPIGATAASALEPRQSLPEHFNNKHRAGHPTDSQPN